MYAADRLHKLFCKFFQTKTIRASKINQCCSVSSHKWYKNTVGIWPHSYHTVMKHYTSMCHTAFSFCDKTTLNDSKKGRVALTPSLEAWAHGHVKPLSHLDMWQVRNIMAKEHGRRKLHISRQKRSNKKMNPLQLHQWAASVLQLDLTSLESIQLWTHCYIDPLRRWMPLGINLLSLCHPLETKSLTHEI